MRRLSLFLSLSLRLHFPKENWRNLVNNCEHPVSSLGEDFPMFELKYDWSRRFQFEFEWIELTIVDNKLGRNGQLAGDWEGKVGKRIPSRSCSPASLKLFAMIFSKNKFHPPLLHSKEKVLQLHVCFT